MGHGCTPFMVSVNSGSGSKGPLSSPDGEKEEKVRHSEKGSQQERRQWIELSLLLSARLEVVLSGCSEATCRQRSHCSSLHFLRPLVRVP